ncbi:autotransporter assembly complex protein TamA [Sphingomonas profundi]|uniref:autotransporter assembly complex protein TamA n=1 Tax=Alterirhizorhabdus profundi TaxID=2681549 RepID=UPI001E53BCAE|nr:BamA/TamA family outer membrane protein [Sphingomonas profundi]
MTRFALAASLSWAAVAATAQPGPVDPEFDAALPPLEATQAPPAEATPAQIPPVAPDPELARPLPPIATFDATPPPATTTQPKADPDARIRYTSKVTGLDAVSLDDAFKALSALRKGKGKAANATQVQARADEDVKLIERLLRSEGYYDGLAVATVDPVGDAPGQVAVTIAATPGDRYALGAIETRLDDPNAQPLTRAALGLKTGDPIVAAAIETAEANVALRLPEQGYPFVAVGARDVLLDDATHRGDYTLPVTAGPRSSFGALRAAGDPVFAVDHLAIFPRFKAGELYDSRKVDDLRQALVATSLFQSVAVEPVRTGTINPDGTEAVDLLVRQAKGPWRSLAASAGYGTGEGIKLTGSWTHRNLFPPEGALTVEAVAGTQQQSVGTTFRRSNAGRRDRTFQANASVARQRFDAYDAETASLAASLARTSTPIWQKKWTYSIGTELIATRETRNVANDTDRTRSTYLIAALPLQLGYDGSDSLLDPTRGFRVSGRLSPEAQRRGGGGGFDGYARMLLETSAYFPATGSIVLAGRARLGSIVGATRDSIAPSRRLYAGGGGSVRGFGFQELGPKDANNDPLGGRSLTEFAVEARYRFGNFGIVPFFDAGRVGEGSTPSLSGLRYGAGIGGRYYTNFGPMRVDIATPINRQPGESKVALYISIGQAF